MNQILCVAAHPGVPSVRPCRARDIHLDTCVNDTCPGCYPRSADRGFLCQHHYDRLESVYGRWREFRALTRELGLSKAVQRDNAGIRQQFDGHVNFTALALSVDECWRFLKSHTYRTLEQWVSTEAGASDALQFTAAAERAYRDHEVKETPSKIKRVRCPHCRTLSLVWMPVQQEGGDVTVQCQNDECGRTLDQSAYEIVANIERGTG